MRTKVDGNIVIFENISVRIKLKLTESQMEAMEEASYHLVSSSVSDDDAESAFSRFERRVDAPAVITAKKHKRSFFCKKVAVKMYPGSPLIIDVLRITGNTRHTHTDSIENSVELVGRFPIVDSSRFKLQLQESIAEIKLAKAWLLSLRNICSFQHIDNNQ